FFQAEDGIRDSSVTGVQTCALPISLALSKVKGGIGGSQERGRRPTMLREGNHPLRQGDWREDLAKVLDIKLFDVFSQSLGALSEIGRASCRARVGGVSVTVDSTR